jgi:MFS family permease
VRRLSRLYYAFCACDDGVLLYPVYALLFADAGLGPAEISSLFVIWSVVGFVLEIPSGAWADTYSRRRLLVLAAVLRGIGFATWTVWPSYPGFALGFVLWGLSGAMSSGAQEALLYDELAALGAGERYPRVLGRATTVGLLAMMAATALASPALVLGGYPLVGAASVVVCAVGALVASRLPEHRRGEPVDGGEGFSAYRRNILAGLREVRASPVVGRAVLVAAVVPGLTALDEYLPLLARAMGASTTAVPLLFLGVIAMMAVAGALAGRWAAAPPARVGALLAVGAVGLAVGCLSGHPVGMAGVAVFFGAVQLVEVITSARLQGVITGPGRATVLSVANVGAEVCAVAIFLGYAAASGWVAVGPILAAISVPVAVVAVLCRWWLPQDRDDHEVRVATRRSPRT